MHRVKHATYLFETDLFVVLPEALAAEVEAVLADETSLVGTEAATIDAFRWAMHADAGMGDATDHWREPLPNLRGRENQTESWVILGGGQRRRLQLSLAGCDCVERVFRDAPWPGLLEEGRTVGDVGVQRKLEFTVVSGRRFKRQLRRQCPTRDLSSYLTQTGGHLVSGLLWH